MMFPKRKPYRNKTYLDYVRAHACCACLASPPSDPHHFMEGGGGMGTKCDDTFTVPLCRTCHTEWHSKGVLPETHSRIESVALMYQQQAMLLARWLRLITEAATADDVF